MTTVVTVSVEVADAQCAIVAARLANGWLRFYTGAQPDFPEDPVPPGAVQLSEHQFGTPAFGTPAFGVMSANPLTVDADSAEGDATWFRTFKADGVTAVFDGRTGLVGSGSAAELNRTDFPAGSRVSVESLVYRVPR